MIERDFDVPFVADLARREKQIQQNYRPIIAVHKWFARRPGTLFRALLLSEFVPSSLRESFYEGHDLRGRRVADPFMGGGTPLLEANRLGCDVIGMDINPMSYWVVKEELGWLNVEAYRKTALALRVNLKRQVGHLYQTKCLSCGSEDALVKYFLWVKVQRCRKCGQDFDLFRGYLVAENRRHPKNVFVCGQCGALTETDDRRHPGLCQDCGYSLEAPGSVQRSKALCPHCGASNKIPDGSQGSPRHRMFAIEYHCRSCKPHHKGRFFKRPDPADLRKMEEAEESWAELQPHFVPDDEIPSGDETDRLHRWGYRHYREMFNSRQLLGLELSCRAIADEPQARIKSALATNLSDLLRYQNMLCRYDTMALKSLDIFSVHGFPVGLIQCESNLLGIPAGGSGMSVGSGGWSNIIDKFYKAKKYCSSPFEIRYEGGRKRQVSTAGEWIGDSRKRESSIIERDVRLSCQNSGEVELPSASLDAVFTDPPYFGNVQYAELMDFCYVWLRRLAGNHEPAFARNSTRNVDELTGNANMGRGLAHFTDGLSGVFQRMAAALKPGRPLCFTYHHNRLEAYLPIAVAILDSGLTCSASLPCPAEMGASIHINGTGSSTVDTVFVCRLSGRAPAKWVVDTPLSLAQVVAQDLVHLRTGNLDPSTGDIRCIIYGHLIRLAVWFLRGEWDKSLPTRRRLAAVNLWIERFGGLDAVQRQIEGGMTAALEAGALAPVGKNSGIGLDDEISL